MDFVYDKLKGRITEKFGSQSAFASAIKLSEHTLSKKLNGKQVWTQKDIAKAIKLLEIEDADIPVYFFVKIIQSVEQ